MTKQKIAVIGLKGLPAFGGAATVGENIIECLKDTYDFTVYATSSHTSSKGMVNGYRQFVFKKLPIKRIDIFYYYLMSALHAVFVKKYDLIHLHHIDGAFILFILRLRYKIVSTSHARSYTRDKWNAFERFYFRINERIYLSLSNVLTVVSLELQKAYTPRTRKKIHYIPNGTKIDIQVRDVNTIDEEDYVLFAAGRIMAAKGCHILLEALNKIKYKGRVLVIGDLNQIPKYKAKVLKLASSLNVKFIDLIRDKALLMAFIKKSRLFVFPSSKEAMSIMLLEAATMKAQMVCSDIPENKAVFNEEEVLFFKTDDPDDLAEKFSWAIDHLEVMKSKAEKAYKRLETEYQWSSISENYHKLFQDLTKN